MTCEHCGGPVRRIARSDPKRGYKKGDYQRFCSPACGARALSPSGPEHPRWAGGVSRNGAGYVWDSVEPDDPLYEMGYDVPGRRRRQVLQHRLVLARHLGRPLSPDEHVHHINRNRADNRLENLQLLSREEHAIVHWEERRRGEQVRGVDSD
jgi:hypothetical protein